MYLDNDEHRFDSVDQWIQEIEKPINSKFVMMFLEYNCSIDQPVNQFHKYLHKYQPKTNVYPLDLLQQMAYQLRWCFVKSNDHSFSYKYKSVHSIDSQEIVAH